MKISLTFSYIFIISLSLIIEKKIFSKITQITVCTDEQNNWPWHFNLDKGLSFIYLSSLEKKLPIKFNLNITPWKRCIQGIKKNEIDAVLNMSFTQERSHFANFPLNLDGKADITKRLYIDSYSFYVRKKSRIVWKNNTLSGLVKPIETTLGYSVISKLNELKLTNIIAHNNPVTKQFEELLYEEVDAIAALDFEAGYQLSLNKKYSENIIKLTPVIEEKPYFLTFSQKFSKEKKALVEKIWDEIPSIRNGEEFNQKTKAFLKY